MIITTVILYIFLFLIFDFCNLFLYCKFKFGDVNENGEYVSPFSNPTKRFGMTLGALSTGRIGITSGSIVHLKSASMFFLNC